MHSDNLFTNVFLELVFLSYLMQLNKTHFNIKKPFLDSNRADSFYKGDQGYGGLPTRDSVEGSMVLHYPGSHHSKSVWICR